MNIYLDIDGTLIDSSGRPTEGVHEFLEWILAKETCYWLTTHCVDGSLDHLYGYLSNKLEPKTFELIKQIKPTT